MRSTRRETVRVHLSAAGVTGFSEPMTAEQARAWTRRAMARFSGLRFRLIDGKAELAMQASETHLARRGTSV
jgi:hypothetical protein